MTFACPEFSLREVLDAAVEHRYHGVELRIDANHKHGVEVFAARDTLNDARKRFDSADIEVCCLATSLQFIRDSVLKDAPARIDLANQLGCHALRVFCGPMPEGTNMADTVRIVADHLTQVADLALQAEVQLLLETHDTFCKASDASRAVRLCGRPNVGINYDNMHPFRKGEPLAETLQHLDGLIRHTHFHDALNLDDKVVITPVGKGQLPIDEMFTALHNANYDGYLSGEWFHTMYGPDPSESLRLYRKDMQELCDRHGVALAK